MPTEEWRMIKVYECPKCGELLRNMDDACNHVCKRHESQKVRENYESMPNNGNKLNDYRSDGNILDLYGRMFGCERKKNESNDAYRERMLAREKTLSI